MNLKILTIILIVLLVLNMILFALKQINSIVFWTIIILMAVFAYLILPKMNKYVENKK